jgi:hypothetical protein
VHTYWLVLASQGPELLANILYRSGQETLMFRFPRCPSGVARVATHSQLRYQMTILSLSIDHIAKFRYHGFLSPTSGISTDDILSLDHLTRTSVRR